MRRVHGRLLLRREQRVRCKPRLCRDAHVFNRLRPAGHVEHGLRRLHGPARSGGSLLYGPRAVHERALQPRGVLPAVPVVGTPSPAQTEGRARAEIPAWTTTRPARSPSRVGGDAEALAHLGRRGCPDSPRESRREEIGGRGVSHAVTRVSTHGCQGCHAAPFQCFGSTTATVGGGEFLDAHDCAEHREHQMLGQQRLLDHSVRAELYSLRGDISGFRSASMAAKISPSIVRPRKGGIHKVIGRDDTVSYGEVQALSRGRSHRVGSVAEQKEPLHVPVRGGRSLRGGIIGTRSFR